MKNVCSREPCDSHRFAHFPFHIVHFILHIVHYIAVKYQLYFNTLGYSTVQSSCFVLQPVVLPCTAKCGTLWTVFFAYFSTALHINYHVCAALHMAVRSTSIEQSSSWALAVAYCCVKFCTELCIIAIQAQVASYTVLCCIVMLSFASHCNCCLVLLHIAEQLY